MDKVWEKGITKEALLLVGERKRCDLAPVTSSAARLMSFCRQWLQFYVESSSASLAPSQARATCLSDCLPSTTNPLPVDHIYMETVCPLARVSPIIREPAVLHFGKDCKHRCTAVHWFEPSTANTISRYSIHNLVYFVVALPLFWKWQKTLFPQKKGKNFRGKNQLPRHYLLICICVAVLIFICRLAESYLNFSLSYYY